MSTIKYPLNGIDYKIGTIGWEWPKRISDLIDSTIPTYGLWGGPGWSGGDRVSDPSKIEWGELPCMNNSIIGSTTPENCFSLTDAICKQHDSDYDDAGNNAQEIMDADIDLLNHIKNAAQTGLFSSYVDGATDGNGQVTPKTYAGTFDNEEKQYLNLLIPAFTIKMLIWDAASSLWSQAVDAFNSIWTTLGLSNTTYTDPVDSSRKTIVKVQTNSAIVYETDQGRVATGWALDRNATKGYTLATVEFAIDGIRSENTFAYDVSKGKYCVNGSTGKDIIEVSKDVTHQAQLVLAGGGDIDTYKIAYGSRNYKIEDAGLNYIYYADADGKYDDRIGNFYKETTDVAWNSVDGKEHLTHASPWTIHLEDGSTIELGENLVDGDFGIHLLEIPDAPTTTNTIIGTDEGNYLSPIEDTAQNDRIEGRGGDDWIGNGGGYGGNDWLQGNNGNDLVQAGSGDDIIEGNLGSDQMQGGAGDDKLFGDNVGEMEQLIADGETAISVNERGDIINGGAGNDYVYGSNRNDALFGSDGHDLIVGGGGDDAIYGDDYFTTAGSGGSRPAFWDDWSFTITPGEYVSMTNINYVQSTFQGDDVIYAGTGNDFVVAGRGGDEVYGGEGNDTVFGEAGDDFIEGGAGNDYLHGDASWVSASDQGNALHRIR